MNAHARITTPRPRAGLGPRAVLALTVVLTCSPGCTEHSARTTARSGAAGAGAGTARSAASSQPEGSPPPPSSDSPVISPQEGSGSAREGCDPGFYVGSYSCQEGFAGPVAFDLVVSETLVQDAACMEFCTDLVISEESGMLYGNWFILAFQGRLEGGLDCRTGEFRASLVDGAAGLPDPSDPKKLLGLNTFGGKLIGKHQRGAPQSIAGEWSLMNADSSCIGTFSLQREDAK